MDQHYEVQNYLHAPVLHPLYHIGTLLKTFVASIQALSPSANLMCHSPLTYASAVPRLNKKIILNVCVNSAYMKEKHHL